MKKTIKDLYEYFSKKYDENESLSALMIMYGVYCRYSDLDKSDKEYEIITDIVEGFTNSNMSKVRFAYSDKNRETAYQEALNAFISKSKLSKESFDDWFDEAKNIKDGYHKIFHHWDVLKIRDDKSYELIDLKDFLDELFGNNFFNKSLLEFMMNYSPLKKNQREA